MLLHIDFCSPTTVSEVTESTLKTVFSNEEQGQAEISTLSIAVDDDVRDLTLTSSATPEDVEDECKVK